MRTKLSRWQIKELSERDDQMRYVELIHTTVAHVSNDIVTYRLDFPVGVAGIQINTIRVESMEDVPFTVNLMDGNTDTTIYESNIENKLHYDSVVIPYKPSEAAVFVRIHNRGSLTTKFTITIRGVEVR